MNGEKEQSFHETSIESTQSVEDLKDYIQLHSQYERALNKIKELLSTVRELRKENEELRKILRASANNNEFIEEIQVLYENAVTDEEKQAALELKLPEKFYTYKENQDCPGCIGCCEPEIPLFHYFPEEKVKINFDYFTRRHSEESFFDQYETFICKMFAATATMSNYSSLSKDVQKSFSENPIEKMSTDDDSNKVLDINNSATSTDIEDLMVFDLDCESTVPVGEVEKNSDHVLDTIAEEADAFAALAKKQSDAIGLHVDPNFKFPDAGTVVFGTKSLVKRKTDDPKE